MSYIAGALGVCVAAFYYVSMIRNMENARKKDIVFQRLQTPIHFYEAYGELLYDLDINSFEDLRNDRFIEVNPDGQIYTTIESPTLANLLDENLKTILLHPEKKIDATDLIYFFIALNHKIEKLDLSWEQFLLP